MNTAPTTALGNSAAASQDIIIFLAVHPPVLAEVAAAVKGGLKPAAVVVSLAPKFTIARLRERLGGCARIENPTQWRSGSLI